MQTFFHSATVNELDRGCRAVQATFTVSSSHLDRSVESLTGFTHEPSLSAMYLLLGPSCVKLHQNQLKRAPITHKRILCSLPLSKNIASLSHSNTTTVCFIYLYKQEKSISQRSWVRSPGAHSRYEIFYWWHEQHGQTNHGDNVYSKAQWK